MILVSLTLVKVHLAICTHLRRIKNCLIMVEFVLRFLRRLFKSRSLTLALVCAKFESVSLQPVCMLGDIFTQILSGSMVVSVSKVLKETVGYYNSGLNLNLGLSLTHL